MAVPIVVAGLLKALPWILSILGIGSLLGEKVAGGLNKADMDEAERKYRGKQGAEQRAFERTLLRQSDDARLEQGPSPEILNVLAGLLTAQRPTENYSQVETPDLLMEKATKNSMESMANPDSPYTTSRQSTGQPDMGDVLAHSIGTTKAEIKDAVVPRVPPILRMMGHQPTTSESNSLYG